MIAIQNGRIVTPDGIIDNKAVHIQGDRIIAFADGTQGAERVVNAHGRYIMPGIIDIHSDRIEQYIQPRATSQMDIEYALKVCERDLLGAGITTMYHSISLYKKGVFGGSSDLRTQGNMQIIADLIADIHMRFHLIHHRFHLRIEIDNIDAFDIAWSMISQGKVHLISFMDHTPGQGQYRDLSQYRGALADISDSDFEALMKEHQNKPKLSFQQQKDLAAFARSKGIAVASHDDDNAAKLEANKDIGVAISEFPIDMATANKAKELGFYTVVGAPNILRGRSHSGNMSASEAILAGGADILCSDYYPAAVLQSIFYMHEKYNAPLHQIVNMATLNPAKATCIDNDYGSLEIGKKADLLIVEILDGYPIITHVFVDGNTTSRIEYRKQAL
ncbi:MAG: alpha-D-ribose 1-methylphosphonate 5-triphosphate diphosphatase [Eubacteriaceae bacterium]|nr:alpha-D-ribose 1-methylphosphonate 5-triphosphate diphosphatase [Eubacteriaceae bacterium]